MRIIFHIGLYYAIKYNVQKLSLCLAYVDYNTSFIQGMRTDTTLGNAIAPQNEVILVKR